MGIQAWRDQLQQQRAIAVIRASEGQQAKRMAHAIAAAGLRNIEITWNSPTPARLIAELRAELPNCYIGAGTLLTGADMAEAIAAGAQYLFTPHTCVALIEQAIAAQLPIIPGALTPSEIVQCWQAGATCVKVFPVHALGGPRYIRSLQGPLGQISLIPTGGITLTNAQEFLAAGAFAVGLSESLFPARAIAAGDWHAITVLAQDLLTSLKHSSYLPSGTPAPEVEVKSCLGAST